jgi:hypothetical protein
VRPLLTHFNLSVAPKPKDYLDIPEIARGRDLDSCPCHNANFSVGGCPDLPWLVSPLPMLETSSVAAELSAPDYLINFLKSIPDCRFPSGVLYP